jgi:DNA-binding response OmpR family regulator
MNIYVLDDREENRKLITQILQSHTSHEVYDFSTGETLLKYMERGIGEPDLFLLDIIMEGMDGYEVAAHLKKNKTFADVPIIFLTALDDKESLAKGFKSGGSDYISKPFSKEELLARINVHLNLRQSMRDLKNHSLELKRDKELFYVRGKELRSLYQILQQGMSSLSLEDFFNAAARDIIPKAFSSGTPCRAFIQYRDRIYHSSDPGEKPPDYSVKAPLKISGKEKGSLVVGFRSSGKGMTTEFEQKIVFLFAEKLSQVINHYEKESALRYEAFLLKKALEKREERGYILFSADYHVIAHNQAFLEAFRIQEKKSGKKKKKKVLTLDEMSTLMDPHYQQLLKTLLDEDIPQKVTLTGADGEEFRLFSWPLEEEGIVAGKLWVIDKMGAKDG